MKSNIALRGIERQLTVSNGADGGMQSLVGWRMQDGNMRLQPSAVKVEIPLKEKESLLYVHRFMDYEHYVVYGNGKLCVRGKDRVEYGMLLAETVSSVSSIGNMLIVHSDKGMIYMLWDNGKYRQIKEVVLPLVLFERVPGGFAGDSEDATIIAPMDYPLVRPTRYPIPIEDDNIKRDLASTYIYGKDSLKLRAYEENAFVEPMYVRYAIRSFDGGTVMVSPPILLPAASEFELLASGELDDKMRGEELRCHVRIKDGYKVRLHIPIDDRIKQIDSRMYPYLDVYVSQPINRDEGLEKISGLSSISTSGDYGSAGTYHIGYEIEKRPIDVSSNVVYYRVMQLSMEELSGRTEDIYDIDMHVGEQMSQLYQLDVLEQPGSIHRYASAKGYVYNNRYHIYDVEQTFFGGWNRSNLSYVEADDGGSGIVGGNKTKIIVYLQAEGMEMVLRPQITEEYSGSVLNALLSYPDSRAYKMILYSSTQKAEVALRPHEMEDMAYYYREDGLPWESITTEEYELLEKIAISDKIIRPNIMKVSELNNPMLWPNEKTYAVGSGKIVSMGVATKAISQGQFGQYPLYVFTDEGIWVMQGTDTQVSYATLSPLSRDVVTNADSICGIDEAVVYGTKQGLYILSGGERVCITTALDDHGVSRCGDNSLSAVVEELTGVLRDETSLSELLSRGVVSYHYHGGEILLYIPNDRYVYAYGLRTGMWSSYNISVLYSIPSYPDLLLARRGDDDVTEEICRIDEGGTEICKEQLMVTRGISLGSMDAKRLSRLGVLSYLGGSKNTTTIAIGVAVSNDGESWKLVWRRELYVEALYNMSLSHVASGYRYISLIIHSKQLSKDSYMHSLDVEWNVKRMER
ncbi:MAG: hypothetical protein U0L54_04115 [Bacteroidales bacterium]|nr:hypothetical protein [Bacteroidales bacterium]